MRSLPSREAWKSNPIQADPQHRRSSVGSVHVYCTASMQKGGGVNGAAAAGEGGSPAAGVAERGQDLIMTDLPYSQQYQ